VKTPRGSFEYHDGFYACQKLPGVVYVDNMDQAFSTLAARCQ
jgi:hypothetical protein